MEKMKTVRLVLTINLRATRDVIGSLATLQTPCRVIAPERGLLFTKPLVSDSSPIKITRKINSNNPS